MKKFLRFIKDWNEILSIPVALILWFTFPYIIRLFDATAAFYDSGVLQQIIYAIIAVLIFHGLAWLLIKLTFPKLYDYLDNEFEDLFTNLFSSEWEKTKISLSIFALYFLAFILTLKTIA